MKKWHLVALVAIVALGAFLRFYQIKEIPLGLYPDEAMNGNNAREAIQTGQWKVFYPENNGREGLFINLQAISVAALGNTPWALRIVSAIIGTLTILGIYLVARELFENWELGRKPTAWLPTGEAPEFAEGANFENSRGEIIPLLSAFFLAASYWHLNFSRIGFRAIMLPLLACLGMYFLLRGLRTGKTITIIIAGIFAGLGFYTYIAYRFMIFVAVVPIIFALRQWRKQKSFKFQVSSFKNPCAPCGILLFLFITFVAALPIGIYFLHNPQEFSNRSGEISVFSASSPVKELAISAAKTAGMFFWRGDCNWRHNYNCTPELHPLVALFFALGIILALLQMIPRRKLNNEVRIGGGGKENPSSYSSFIIHNSIILFAWLLFMAVPVALTREGIPHALRSIGMIPPAMILSAVGAKTLGSFILSWFERQKQKWPAYSAQLQRIRRELTIMFVLILLFIPLATYRTYFIAWAENKNTYEAFDASSWHLGEFLAGTAPEIKKYIVVNTLGTPVRGIPMPAQSVMFATNTFTQTEQVKKYFTYLAGGDIQTGITIPAGQKTLIAFLNGSDRALIRDIQKKYPELKIKVPGDFVILQNY